MFLVTDFTNLELWVEEFFLDPSNPEFAIAADQVRPDGKAEWIAEMFTRTAPHDEDYVVLRHLNQGGGCILDIGANYGYSVTSLMAVGSTLNIVSFEPFPFFASCFDEIKARMGERYEYRLHGLAAEPGEIEFRTPVVNGEAITALTSSNPQSNAHDLAGDIRYSLQHHLPKSSSYDLRFFCFNARVEPLDNIVRSIALIEASGRIAAMKIDTESTEEQVVVGATEVLKQHQPLLLIERARPSLINRLGNLGYLRCERVDDRLLIKDNPRNATNQFFVHPAMLEPYRQMDLIVS
jgi:FkbM family methyltransferase